MSKAVGYNDDNANDSSSNTCPREIGDVRLGDAQNISRREVDIDLPKEDTVLLKEPDLY